MNTCQNVQDEMHACLDAGRHNLSAKARDHLEACGACRSRWRALCRAEDALGRLGEAGPRIPEGFQARVMAAVAQEPRDARRPRRWTRRVAWALAAMLAVVFIGGLLANRPQRLPTDTPVSTAAADYTSAPAVARLVGETPGVAEVREDFAWIGNMLRASAGSAARAVNPAELPGRDNAPTAREGSRG